MRTIQKIGVLTVSVMGGVMLWGCPKEDAGTAGGTAGGTKPVSTTAPSSGGSDSGGKSLRIAVIPKGTANSFWLGVKAGADDAAKKIGNIEIIWQGPATENDVTQQVDVVQTQVSNKVDGIVLAAVDSEALAQPVTAAKAANIPTVTVDSGLLKGKDDSVCYIATDNVKGGQLAADKLADAIGKKGNVGILIFKKGSASNDERESGFLEEMKKYPDIHVVSNLEGGDPTKAVDRTNDMLTANKDLAGIFAANQPNGEGAAQVLKQKKLEGKVKLVAFDSSEDEIKGLQEGTIQALIRAEPVPDGLSGRGNGRESHQEGNDRQETARQRRHGRDQRQPQHARRAKTSQAGFIISMNDVKSAPQRIRLDFLDGIRGFAALYVMQYHLMMEPYILPTWLFRLLTHGTMFVAVFIVLSGYCLMLPIVRSAGGELRGGAWDYLKRRARRILPPYYAALALTSVIILVGRVRAHSPLLAHPPSADAVFAPVNVLLHVTLLHNFSLKWYQTIDPPMWSVAPEWQIYFLFPLILLPLWRRFGMVIPLLTTLAAGILPHLLLPSNRNGDYLCIWYIALFTFGMMSAVVSFSPASRTVRLRERIPWALLAGILGTLIVVLTLLDYLKVLWDDLLVGGFTCALLIYCAKQASVKVEGARSPLLRFLESRVMVGVGVFSYSLYLIHLPARFLMETPMRALHLKGASVLVYEAVVFIPFALGVSYLFHLAVERRFMPGHPRNTRQAARAAEVSPAP